MHAGFVRWELRTIDPHRARSFYDALLEQGAGEVTTLPEAALARGARPHWLGHLAVEDVAEATSAFVSRGAHELGGGRQLRDPGGAVFSLTSRAAPGRTDVIWQLHMSPAPERIKADYAALCGMTMGERVEIPGQGVFDQFSWGDGRVIGSIGDTTDKPHIHPQWLFHFRVPDIDRAVGHVKERGGVALGPMELPDGTRIAACDDPLGAAFGLMQPSS